MFRQIFRFVTRPPAALILFAILLVIASCAKPPVAVRPAHFSVFPLDPAGGFADEIWLINTANAGMARKHLVDGGSKDKVLIPILCVLVRHGDDYLLIDTGINHNFAFKPAEYLGKTTFFFAKMVRDMPTMTPGQDVVAQVTRLGLIPEQITKIVLTHAHFDHTGELGAFPKAKVLIGPGETKFIQRAFGVMRGVMQKDFPWDRITEATFKGSKPLFTFEGRYDLYGDNSVILCPTPGHTPGSISVLVRTSSQTFLFVGDAAYAPENYEKSVNTGYNDSPEKSLDSILRLHDLHKAMPEIRIMCSHDPAWAHLSGKLPSLLTPDRPPAATQAPPAPNLYK